MTGSVAYDADAKSRARQERTYTVGSRVYRPVRKTGGVVRRILELGKGESVPDGLAGPALDDWWHQQSLRSIDTVYRQVAELLVDDTGEHPVALLADLPEGSGEDQALEGVLDIEDARGMIRELMPNPNLSGNEVAL